MRSPDMPDGGDTLSARTVSSMGDIDPTAWERLAHPPGAPFNPFVSYEFLDALERSGSATAETGWAPAHLVVEDAGALVAAAPLYAKGHSQGEYIFDHHWADAYGRAGGAYYPKLLSAAPFTPAQGPRLLAETPAHKRLLANALRQLCGQMGVSSVHVNFIDEADQRLLSEAGFLPRIGEQFHWFNRGYETFDDFLETLASRKRKAIRRERRGAATSGLTIRKLMGGEITPRHWDAFWLFYQDTGARKWGRPYLTRAFFDIIAETMRERLLLIAAEDDGEPVAGALNFIGGDTLYGRYWGCLADIPFMHFELCYHQAIDFAIEHKLKCVEAGAQGEHKIARGYEPVATRSAHWIANESFRDAIDRYLTAERRDTDAGIEALKSYTPFKKT
ncbi:MAG: GNAT family N-acetyltransferase [Pseudomonadota bacterium]